MYSNCWKNYSIIIPIYSTVILCLFLLYLARIYQKKVKLLGPHPLISDHPFYSLFVIFQFIFTFILTYFCFALLPFFVLHIFLSKYHQPKSCSLKKCRIGFNLRKLLKLKPNMYNYLKYKFKPVETGFTLLYLRTAAPSYMLCTVYSPSYKSCLMYRNKLVLS